MKNTNRIYCQSAEPPEEIFVGMDALQRICVCLCNPVSFQFAYVFHISRAYWHNAHGEVERRHKRK